MEALVRFKRRLQSRALVDLVPMIDVVFQLILFFLVSTTFAIMPGITLKLPESSTAEAVAMTRLTIGVKSQNEVYLNSNRLSLSELDASLAQLSPAERSEIKSVTLEADTGIPYGLTIEILDILRKNGFRGINLHTLEK
jgi:biopolymer transport protein ExbD